MKSNSRDTFIDCLMEAHTCIIPECGKWRQEKQKFKASLGYNPESKTSLGYINSCLQRREGERRGDGDRGRGEERDTHRDRFLVKWFGCKEATTLFGGKKSSNSCSFIIAGSTGTYKANTMSLFIISTRTSFH